MDAIKHRDTAHGWGSISSVILLQVNDISRKNLRVKKSHNINVQVRASTLWGNISKVILYASQKMSIDKWVIIMCYHTTDSNTNILQCARDIV